MDILDKVKSIFSETPIVEGAKDTYDLLNEMDDKEIKKRFMGKAPVGIPREAQEELFKRFVAPAAHQNCKVCHGRGRKEWDAKLHQYVPCDCLQRVIRDHEEENNLGHLYDPLGNKINFMN